MRKAERITEMTISRRAFIGGIAPTAAARSLPASAGSPLEFDTYNELVGDFSSGGWTTTHRWTCGRLYGQTAIVRTRSEIYRVVRVGRSATNVERFFMGDEEVAVAQASGNGPELVDWE